MIESKKSGTSLFDEIKRDTETVIYISLSLAIV